MKSWCALGEVPTAENLNLYWGRSSHVGWHSDDEPLFGRARGFDAHCLGELWYQRTFPMEGQVLFG